MRFRLVVLSLAFLTFPAAGQSPASPPSATSYRNRVLGVFNGQTGEPIEGATVLDVLTKTSALTTRTGTVTLAFLGDGPSLLRIQKLGYQAVMLPVEISPADTVPLTVILTSLAQQLPAVNVIDSAPHYISPGLRAFEERRKLGFGHFIPEVELRKNDLSKVTQVARWLPGLKFICPRTGVRRGECWAASSRATSKNALLGGLCDVDVYIDGTPSLDNDLEKLRVSDFAGVEFYAGGASMPPQYNRTGSSCGVILLWTRER